MGRGKHYFFIIHLFSLLWTLKCSYFLNSDKQCLNRLNVIFIYLIILNSSGSFQRDCWLIMFPCLKCFWQCFVQEVRC